MSKCESCKKKKLGALPFSCRCGLNQLCITCRYPESHDCKYDHKKEGRILLEKNNPQVIGLKLEKL
jgi:hypothetical protein